MAKSISMSAWAPRNECVYTLRDVERFKRNFQRAHRAGSLRACYWVQQWAKALVLIGEGI